MRHLVSSVAALLAGAAFFSAQAAGASSYTMADYGRVSKIDAHLHLHNAGPAFMEAARRQRFRRRSPLTLDVLVRALLVGGATSTRPGPRSYR